MLNWIGGLVVAAAVSGVLAFRGVGGAPAALGQTAFPALLLLVMGLLLFAAAWNR